MEYECVGLPCPLHEEKLRVEAEVQTLATGWHRSVGLHLLPQSLQSAKLETLNTHTHTNLQSSLSCQTQLSQGTCTKGCTRKALNASFRGKRAWI